MAEREMAKVRTVYYCSSSIANFREKLHKRLGLKVWTCWKNKNDRVIFFGLYHWKDYLRFLWQRGQKKVFWCGGDILRLSQTFLGIKKSFWINWVDAKHYCENEVERMELQWNGIEAEIRPMIFDDPDKFEVSYKHSEKPRLFASYHKGREKEYAPVKRLYIDYLNGYSEQQYNERIKDYAGSVRFNTFDGFSENLAKSVLMGQYPISWIRYPQISCLQDISLEEHLEILKTKTEPNITGREYWIKVLEENKNELINSW